MSSWGSIRHCCPRSRSMSRSLPRRPRTPAPPNSAPARASGSLAGQWSRLSPVWRRKCASWLRVHMWRGCVSYLQKKRWTKKAGRVSKLNITSKQPPFDMEFLRSPREPLILQTVMASRTLLGYGYTPRMHCIEWRIMNDPGTGYLCSTTTCICSRESPEINLLKWV